MKKFIRVLVQEAVNCEVYGHESFEKVPKKSNPTRPPSSRGNKGEGKGTRSDMPATGRKKLPICIWPKHKEQGVRHHLRDCKDCPKDEKDKLFDDLRKSKAGGIKRTPNKDSVEIDESTRTIFSATFGGKWRTTVGADNSADANILDSRTLAKLKDAAVDHFVEYLPGPRSFDMAACTPDGKRAKLVCTRALIVDAELHIRHGTALLLRCVRRLVTDQAVGDPLLGRPILEALGLNARNMLAAAAEKHSGVVDMSTFFGTDPEVAQEGRISRVLEGVYHADGGPTMRTSTTKTGGSTSAPRIEQRKKSFSTRKFPRPGKRESLETAPHLLRSFSESTTTSSS